MPSFATRRQQAVNYGDRTRIEGSKSDTLVWVSVEQSSSWVLYATATLSGAGLTDALVPVIALEWGHGGASVSSEYPAGERVLRVPLVASMIKATGRVVDTTGAPVPPSVVCTFDAFVAEGQDGLNLPTTRIVARTGAEGLVTRGASVLFGCEGFNTQDSGGTRWLMFFEAEARPPNGTVPFAAVPVAPSPQTFALGRPRSFRRGIYWAASLTGASLTFDSGASLRVDAELLL